MAARELIEERMLGALRFIDAVTGLPIMRRFDVRSDGRLLRNRRGLVVIAEAPGLESHSAAFEAPPEEPALGSIPFDIEVADPGGRYLPRRLTVALPRAAAPEAENSVFEPVESRLFRSPTATTSAGWAIVRASVRDTDGAAMGGALVRLIERDTETVLARALTEWRGGTRGEALVALPGVPVTTFSDSEDEEDEPISNQLPVRLEAIVDPVFQAALPPLTSSFADLSGPAGVVPDPDDLESRAALLPSIRIDFDVAAGQSRAAALVVDLA